MAQADSGRLSNLLKSVQEYIREINDNLLEESPEDNLFDAGTTTIRFQHQGFGGLTISGDEAKRYRLILRDLHQGVVDKGDEHTSPRYIENHLEAAILKAIDPPGLAKQPFDARLKSAISDLRTSLQIEPTAWQIYTEVAGISRAGLPFTVGPITFHLGGDTFAAERVAEWSVMQAQTLNPFEAESLAYQSVEQSLTAKYSKGVFAQAEVRATDADAAETLAVEKIRLTLDVLNFFTDIIFRLAQYVRAYLPGDASDAQREVLCVSRNGTWNRSVSLAGPLDIYNFSLITPERAARTGFDALMAILAKAKNERTTMETRVLVACQWAGRATAETRTDQQFLLYAVALESLLLGNKDTEITYRLSSRCAHLLGDTLNNRKIISKKTKDLYRIRSKIVHTGSTDVSGEDLGSLWRYVKKSLIIVASDEPFTRMTTEEQFEGWFEDRMLGSLEEALQPL